MRVDLFDYELPEKLIAKAPVSPRDSARLLHVPACGRFSDRTVRDLPSLLRRGDVMVFNDTKVIPARLMGKRGDVSVEVLLHRRTGEREWVCFAKPAKRLKDGQEVIFADDFKALVLGRAEDGQVRLAFETDDIFAMLDKYGELPLPPYMQRRAQETDKATYQTAYALHPGSVAAPTAGLHFTPELLKAIDDAGVTRAHVTLHVGAGTFLPVKADDTDDHVMHAEWWHVTPETAVLINTAKREGRRVIAVGTTSMRTLESAGKSGTVGAGEAETRLFITPGYDFKIVDALMTNFHLPRSTLLMLVSAFAGYEKMREAYRHAIAQAYRFYSYGDSSFIERCQKT
ncbi:MAG: tRNA preQ1(34) S-adenosylmethionine ribosyltransferase-isomerase QueA [Alphaproteobacteria bacterium]|nr:tRNA preQ1(34) S-adenosylmethionine ribosyltransferase-isomerase QueA [Alphaproteobacteria bacterium]